MSSKVSRRKFLAGLGVAAGAIVLGTTAYEIFYLPSKKELPTLVFTYNQAQPHHANLFYLPTISEKYGFKTSLVKTDRYVTADLYVSKDQAQFGGTGYADIIFVSRDLTPNWLCIAGVAVGAEDIVVRKDVVVNSWKDLEGKTIGMPLRGLNEIALNLAIKDYNLDANKIKIVNVVPGPAALSALEKKQIDVINGWEVATSEAVVRGLAYRPPFSNLPLPQFQPASMPPNSVLAVSKTFLEKAGDGLVTNVVKALNESTNYLMNNRSAWIDISSKFLGIDSKVVEESLKTMQLDTNVYLQPVYNIIKTMLEIGILSVDPSSKVEDYVTYKYLEAATGKSKEQLGWAPQPK